MKPVARGEQRVEKDLDRAITDEKDLLEKLQTLDEQVNRAIQQVDGQIKHLNAVRTNPKSIRMDVVNAKKRTYRAMSEQIDILIEAHAEFRNSFEGKQSHELEIQLQAIANQLQTIQDNLHDGLYSKEEEMVILHLAQAMQREIAFDRKIKGLIAQRTNEWEQLTQLKR